MKHGNVRDKLMTKIPTVTILTKNKVRNLKGTPPKYSNIKPAKNTIAAVERLAGKIIAQITINGANNFHETFFKSCSSFLHFTN